MELMIVGKFAHFVIFTTPLTILASKTARKLLPHYHLLPCTAACTTLLVAGAIYIRAIG